MERTASDPIRIRTESGLTILSWVRVLYTFLATFWNLACVLVVLVLGAGYDARLRISDGDSTIDLNKVEVDWRRQLWPRVRSGVSLSR